MCGTKQMLQQAIGLSSIEDSNFKHTHSIITIIKDPNQLE